MRESDASYFRRRACEERVAAERATSAEARFAHLEMAERYDELAGAIDYRSTEIPLRVVN